MIRENSVLTDFIGFLSSSDPSYGHEDSAGDAGRTNSRSACFRLAPPGGIYADSRTEAAALRLQAQMEAAQDKKQGSVVLVVALKDLERLEIGADP